MKISADIVGREAEPDEQRVDARWLMAYSAGLGETAYPHPLFPVCYEWPATRLLRERAGLAPIDARLVHAQHDLTIHRPPAQEKLFIAGKVVAAIQRKPGVLVVFRFTTHGGNGDVVSVTDFSALYRDVQLEGGDRSIAALEDPPAHEGKLEPAGSVAVAGLPDIILHGTATLALSVSRVLEQLEMKRVKRVRCRFAGMVLMPSLLTVHAARGEGVAFETRNDRGEAVIQRGWVELG